MDKTRQDGGKGSAAKAQTKSATATTSRKRLSISLSDDAASLLEFLAQTQGITQNEALRRAISTEAYLFEERRQGTKVLLQKSDQEIREVLFR
ncbi:ribbon-helix-helix protein, CopG family [Lyngbya confervoides]|uniref:Ribbon-helix-helix protein, CopG family n=1 Tax=Lyngbya confervoides BDU141951 TaxID=1574623 RepID=A0ABD4T7K4_9CYAN|nr:ribbon-helix-helix protein, CopG family [Lyngbya confervoides]MCM1984448.1 ribbon-helix-helix protein, CopG family [Lyngbya confervoides BDU141951]